MRSILVFVVALLIFTQTGYTENNYVGSEKCKDCHEKEYRRFQKYSKKAESYKHIALMEKGLTQEEFKKCFTCHTTGYGKQGGFISLSQTPKLKNNGCESCHGPGGDHIASEDPEDIKAKLTIDDCIHCHNSERVKSFKFKPLKYAGAH